MPEEQYHVLQREADCFTVNLLAPMTIMNRISSLKTEYDYMEICELSKETLENCLRDFNLLKSGKKIPFPTKEENVLFRYFFDDQYDDYTECNYCDFIVIVIRKWKFEKGMHAAL